MSNIYQINDKFLSVLNMADEDVDPQVIQDTLDSIELELNEKVDNIVGLKRSVDSDVDAIDKELKRLQELKKSYSLSYIFVTHDLLTLTYICDSVIFFKEGRIVEKVDSLEKLCEVKDDYSKALLDAVIEF